LNVAVIGASQDRTKFGNKAVRAYVNQGHTVFPINPGSDLIEGLKSYPSILQVVVDIDITLVYLPPPTTLTVLPEVARKGTGQLFLNPGSENADVVAKARELGLEPILACSIIAAGESPTSYGP
jgi:predicted CoA-binding protein